MNKQDFIKSHKDKLLQIYKELTGSTKGFDSWLNSSDSDEAINKLMSIAQTIKGVADKEAQQMGWKDAEERDLMLGNGTEADDWVDWQDDWDAFPEVADNNEELPITDEPLSIRDACAKTFAEKNALSGVDIFGSAPLDKQMFITEHKEMLQSMFGETTDLTTDSRVDYLMNAPEEVIQALSGVAFSKPIDGILNERGELLTELPFNGCEETLRNIELNDLALTCIQDIDALLDLYVEAGDKTFSKEAKILDMLVNYIKTARKAKDTYEELKLIIQG